MINAEARAESKRAGGLEQTMDEFERLATSDFDRPIETIEPARLSSPLIFSSPHSGSTYPERFLAASRLDPLDAAPVRGRLSWTNCSCLASRSGRRCCGPCSPGPIWTSIASPTSSTRRCSTGRLPDFANTRSLQGCGRSRHHSEGRRRRAADLQAADIRLRGSRPHRGPLSTVSRAVDGRLSSAPNEWFGRAVLARLPLDAEQRR